MLAPLAVLLILAAGPAPAQVQLELEQGAGPGGRASPDRIDVDVELALMVDVSRSMSARELEIQRRGYAEALRSQQVIDAITGGMLGQVAISYIEWSGAGMQRVVVDWRLLRSAEDAHAFADALESRFEPSMRRTSISGALAFASRSIAANGYEGLRRVIDVSGDGPNNQGQPVAEARDSAVALGMVVNGLPLMTREGMGARWTLDDLDVYYRACVIGGPGAFVIPVTDWSEFAQAVRRKLVLELAGPDPAPIPVQADYDCLVGEEIWRRNRGYWTLP